MTDVDRAQAFYSTTLDSGGARVSPERHYFDSEGTILACFDPLEFDEKPTATPTTSTSTSP